MEYVFCGGFISIISVIFRAVIFNDRKKTTGCKYWGFMGIPIEGSVIGFIGFLRLAHLPVDSSQIDYSQILTVLSLLATAVITGFFSWSFTESAKDENFIVTAISVCFIGLFYLLFSAISFYMGQSENIHNAPYAAILVPIIMWLLLTVNTLLDFWDYRDTTAD